jgi:hypothetical protein
MIVTALVRSKIFHRQFKWTDSLLTPKEVERLYFEYRRLIIEASLPSSKVSKTTQTGAYWVNDRLRRKLAGK